MARDKKRSDPPPEPKRPRDMTDAELIRLIFPKRVVKELEEETSDDSET